jgi:hypothetical protein
MISGAQPVDGAHAEVAAINMAAFAAEVAARAETEGQVRGYTPHVGEPTRDESVDADGRFGWVLPVNGRPQRILMPGVDLERMRDLSAEAPMVSVNGQWAWWNDAAGAAVPLPDQQPWLGTGPARGRTEPA